MIQVLCRWLIATMIALVFLASHAYATGSVDLTDLKVIDGDTIDAKVEVWPGMWAHERVRLEGIDAPESHSECQQERVLADRARGYLVYLTTGKTLVLTWKGRDKYGRVLGKITLIGGQSVAQMMIDAGLARHYTGGKRLPWC